MASFNVVLISKTHLLEPGIYQGRDAAHRSLLILKHSLAHSFFQIYGEHSSDLIFNLNLTSLMSIAKPLTIGMTAETVVYCSPHSASVAS